jgi:hypothetical protein
MGIYLHNIWVHAAKYLSINGKSDQLDIQFLGRIYVGAKDGNGLMCSAPPKISHINEEITTTGNLTCFVCSFRLHPLLLLFSFQIFQTMHLLVSREIRNNNA